MNKYYKKFKMVMGKNLMLKLTAFLIAFIIFASINQFGNPLWNDLFQTVEYIEAVPLEANYDKEKYVVTGLPDTISVNVKGTATDVETVVRTQDNLVATIDIPYTTPGTYRIDSGDFQFNTIASVQVDPVVQSYEIKVQEKIEKEKAIDITYINGQEATTGYILNNPQLSETEVTIVGGNEDVDSVVSVMGMIDLSEINPDPLTQTQTFTVDLNAYDENGIVVSGVELYPNQIEVTQSYEMATMEVPVTYEIVNNETGLYVSSICDVSSSTDCESQGQQTVEVYGDRNKLNNLTSVTYKIDLEGFNGTSGEVVATPILESGVYILGDYQQTYYIELEEGSSKVIEDVQVIVTGIDPTLEAKASNPSDTKVDVEITGAQSIIEDMDEGDIILSIDLSDINTPGVYTVPIQVSTNSNINYKLEQEQITVEVVEK